MIRARPFLAGSDGICNLLPTAFAESGLDVAWRAFHPRMPITPELIVYPLRLPPGLPRVILVNTVSLLPGTLGTELGGQAL
ncbi:MAG: Na+/H+ antiporter subunit E [Candidatus Thiodiazotropha sp.]